jgi:hypothetical protein
MTAYPDLAIPRYPAHGIFRMADGALLLHRGRGDRSRLLLPAGAAGGAAAALVSLGLPGHWQQAVADGAATLGMLSVFYLLVRNAVQRRQREFERDWLAAQTAELRRYPFAVLGCTLGGREYSMSSPAEIRDLRGQRGNARASLAFTYFADGKWPTIGKVHRRLRDLTFVADVTVPGRAFVRFPQARYLPRPVPAGRAARRTCWSLDGPVLLSVSEAAAGSAAAGGA